MNEVPAAVAQQGYSAAEAAALAQMADALARFGNAIVACEEVGIDLPTALNACGVAVPAWAAPFVGVAFGGGGLASAGEGEPTALGTPPAAP